MHALGHYLPLQQFAGVEVQTISVKGHVLVGLLAASLGVSGLLDSAKRLTRGN